MFEQCVLFVVLALGAGLFIARTEAVVTVMLVAQGAFVSILTLWCGECGLVEWTLEAVLNGVVPPAVLLYAFRKVGGGQVPWPHLGKFRRVALVAILMLLAGGIVWCAGRFGGISDGLSGGLACGFLMSFGLVVACFPGEWAFGRIVGVYLYANGIAVELAFLSLSYGLTSVFLSFVHLPILAYILLCVHPEAFHAFLRRRCGRWGWTVLLVAACLGLVGSFSVCNLMWKLCLICTAALVLVLLVGVRDARAVPVMRRCLRLQILGAGLLVFGCLLIFDGNWVVGFLLLLGGSLASAGILPGASWLPAASRVTPPPVLSVGFGLLAFALLRYVADVRELMPDELSCDLDLLVFVICVILAVVSAGKAFRSEAFADRMSSLLGAGVGFGLATPFLLPVYLPCHVSAIALSFLLKDRTSRSWIWARSGLMAVIAFLPVMTLIAVKPDPDARNVHWAWCAGAAVVLLVSSRPGLTLKGE